MPLHRYATFALGVLVSAGAAAGQSLNVDLDAPTASPVLGGGVPSSTFGAASGQIGVWNSYASTVGPVGLVGLAGEFTPATLSISASSTTVSTLAFNNANNTGNFALLMNDAQQVGTTTQGGTRSFTFSGLIDGGYTLYTYAAPPQGIAGELIVEAGGTSLLNQGTMTGNTFSLGTTHLVHNLTVFGGTFTVRVTDFPGSPSGYVSGFQLILPEPGGLSAAVMAGVALSIRVPRRRRRRRHA